MLNALLNLLFPKICCGCQRLLLVHEHVICTVCRHELPLTDFWLTADNPAMQTFYGRLPLEQASAFLYFHKKGIVQELIHNLKYRGREEIGTVIGLWYGQELSLAPSPSPIDAVVPVPLHRRRLRERGFNQVTAFGQAVATRLGVDYDERLLVRQVYSATQSKKDKESRTSQSTAVFQAEFDASHHGKHFLLVDDVLTTGATLEQCGRALLEIPDSRLSIATMAMSHS